MSHTPNLALPLLYAAQSQKEITHNEALVVLDGLVPGCVEAVATDPGSLVAQAGQSWIVGTAPVGAWVGRAGVIAIFTDGGWRFVLPALGMCLYDRSRNFVLMYDGSEWALPPSFVHPVGGDIVDTQARAAIAALASALQAAGLVDAT